MEDIPDCSLVYNFSPENHQLTCIGQDVTSIPEQLLDEEFIAKTKRLDLSFNCLRNFNGIEEFVNLEELTLDNNHIRHTAIVPNLPKLNTLMMNKNCIDKLEPFVHQMQQQLPQLTYLSLLGNNACPNQLASIDNDDDDYKRYRLFLIYKLPQLRFIDSTPVTAQEREEAQKKGEFLSSVVRPDTDVLNLVPDFDTTDLASPYHPLPLNRPDGDQPKQVGSYGACKYIYYGRHSEGNRFIRNNDL